MMRVQCSFCLELFFISGLHVRALKVCAFKRAFMFKAAFAGIVLVLAPSVRRIDVRPEEV